MEGVLTDLRSSKAAGGQALGKGQLEAHFERQNSAIALDKLKRTLKIVDEEEHIEESAQPRNLAPLSRAHEADALSSSKDLLDRMSLRYGFDQEQEESSNTAQSRKGSRKSAARVTLTSKADARKSVRGPGGKGKNAKDEDDARIEAARRRTQALGIASHDTTSQSV